MQKRVIAVEIFLIIILLSIVVYAFEPNFGYNNKGLEITDNSSGGANVTKFTQLTDVPNSYAGFSGQCVIVNPGETGLIFTNCSATFNVSTFNATYNGIVNNATYLTTFNATYAAFVQGIINDSNANLTNLNIASNLSIFGNLSVVQDVNLANVIIVNSTNGRTSIGLGAGLSAGVLTVRGSGATDIRINTGTNNSNAVLVFQNNNLTKWQLFNSGGSNNQFTILNASNSNVFTINQSGNVGIKISGGLHDFDVIGDGNFTGEVNVTTLCISGVCQTSFTTGSSPFQVTNYTIFNNTANVNFTLGNTTQGQKFQVFPDPNLANYQAFDRVNVDSSTQAFSLNRITINNVNNQSGELFFRKQNNVGKTDYGILTGSSFYIIQQTNGDNLTFGQGNTYTGNGTVQVNKPLFRAVTATNRFGINTINPQNTLEVNGTGNFSGNLSVGLNTLFVNAESNKIGIGTGNPVSELTVIGDLNVTGEGNFTQVCISGNCQTSFSSAGNINDTNVNLSSLQVTNNLTVLGQLSVGMNISMNGTRFVMGGIGYTQPFAGYDSQGNSLFEIGSGKLTVGDLNYTSIAFITNQAGNNNLIGNFFWLNTNLTTADKRIAQWAVNTDGAGNRSVFRFLTNNGIALREVVRINANGSVGINTTTPLHTFDVIGDGNFTGELNVSQLCIQGVCQSSFSVNANINDTNVNLTSLKIANNLTVIGNQSFVGESIFKGNGNASTTPFKVKVIRYGANNIDAVGIDNSENGGGIPFKLGIILTDPTSSAPAVIFTNNNWTAQINALENGSLILVPQANGLIYLQGTTLPRINNSYDFGNQSRQWSSGVFANQINATTLCLSGSCISSVPATGIINDSNANLTSLNVYGNLSVLKNFSVSNNTLFINGANGLVGINSLTPSYALEINNPIKGFNASNYFFVNGTSVGINTSSPIAKLQIGNNNAAGTPSPMPANTGIFMSGQFDFRTGVDDGDSNYGTFLKGDFLNSRSVLNLGVREAGTDFSILYATRKGVGINTNNPSYALEINNASAGLNVSNMLFANVTRVGIGTSNPTHTLNVVGTANVTSNTVFTGNVTIINSTEKNVFFIPRYSGVPFACNTASLGATYIEIGGDLFGGDALCFCDNNGGSPQWTSSDLTDACA